MGALRSFIRAGLIAVGLLSLLASLAQAQQARVARGLDPAFVYYELSGLPVPWTDLARHYSDYRNARDEFERNERFAALRPAMERARDDALRHKTFLLQTGTEVGEYDFANETFPLSFRATMFFTFDLDVPGPRFALSFANGGDLIDWKLPKEKARDVAAMLRNNRRLPVEIEYTPIAAREDNLNYGRYRMIEARAVTMRLLRPDGRGVLGQVSIGASGDRPAAAPARPVAPAAASQRSLGGKVEDMLRGNLRTTEECMDRHGASECARQRRP